MKGVEVGIVSYAQNFEDVILWRVLGHVEHGIYIDIGAQHPVVDSVSNAFYERGWRGVHVEPTSLYANLLREHRPDELVIEAAIASERGLLTFFEIPDTGLSTASHEVVENHRQQGWTVRETKVATLTLEELLQSVSGEVHWLKIDVEGYESEVMSGWGASPVRPWVIVIESTYPNSQRETHEAWEALVLTKGYTLAYIDGLNRYYVSERHAELKQSLRYGPNIFDGFQLSESSWAIGAVKERYKKQLDALIQRNNEVEQQLTSTQQALKQSESECNERGRALQFQADEKINAMRAEARQLSEQWQSMVSELVRAQKDAHHAAEEDKRRFTELKQTLREALQVLSAQICAGEEREQALKNELADLRDAYARANSAAAVREREERLEFECKLDSLRAEGRERIQQFVEHERTLDRRLVLLSEALDRERERNGELTVKVKSHQNEAAALGRDLAAARDIEASLRVDLDQQVERSAAAAAQLARMQQMNSWRLTKPLRWLLDWKSARSS